MVAVVRPTVDGEGRTILVVVAHADDVALFIGGTVASWVDTGWNVVVVRVTDDRWDSVGSSESATITANHDEFRAALDVLGVTDVVEFSMPTDTLGDTSMVALRERIIREVRTRRPYALVSFDPYAMYGEDNLDHIAVARAVDESFWTSQFDLHHPEHLDAGLEPHGCFERWYFGRSVVDVTDVIDIEAALDRKIAAACLHHTMMRNFFNQLRLQARTGGYRIPMIDEALESDHLDDVLARFVSAGAERAGVRHGLMAAEEFRVVTFGGLGGLLDEYGVNT